MLQSASFHGRKTFSRPCNDFDDFGVPSSDDEKELLNLGRYASATARRRQIKKGQAVDTKPVTKPEPIKTEESPKQTQVVVPSKPERKSWADVASDDEDMTDFAWTTQEACVNDATAIVKDEKPTQSTEEKWSWSTAATDSLDELVPDTDEEDLYVPGAKQTPENYLTEQQEQLRQQELLAEQMRQIQLVQMRQEQMRQEQMRQEQLHQEQLRQEQLRKEQLRQEQLRQEQMRQEQMRQEQVRQEQLRQEQLRQEQLQLERLQQQKQQQQQQAQMQMQQLQLQMQQVQGQMQTQGQAQQAMLVAVPMNFMPMMMPSNQMQTAPQHALGYPEDEEQQQQQQAKAIVPLPKYAVGIAFFTIAYVYVTEIFPSAYRCTAASTCMAGGRIGSVLAPLAFELLTSGGESHIPFWLLCSLLCVIAVWVIQRCLTFELKGEPLEDVVLKGGGNLKLKRPSLLTPPENKADKMRTGHRGRHTASAQEIHWKKEDAIQSA